MIPSQLLNESHIITAQCLASNSRRSYNRAIQRYVETLNELPGINPFPITEESLRIYLTFRAKYQNVTMNTIKSDISGIRFYLHSQNFFDCTRSFTFRSFIQGLKRELKEDEPPNRKLPSDMMEQFSNLVNYENFESVRDMTLFSLSFYGFLRISETLNLRGIDIKFVDDGVIVNITHSKTDQIFHGYTCFISKSNKSYSAYNLLAIYSTMKLFDDSPLFDLSKRDIQLII